MTDRDIWAGRVAEWRSSGLTSMAFCRGKPFTPGGLRHWAHQVDGEARQASAGRVRFAQVVKASNAVGSAPAAVVSPVVIELADARVLLLPGFDESCLARALDVLAERRSS